MIRRLAAVAAAGLIGGALVLTGTAHADIGSPDGFKLEVSDKCVVTITADDIPFHVASETKTAGLAIRVDSETIAFTEPTDHENGGPFSSTDELTVGPFTMDTVVEFRWFAGPDRNDLPAWDTENHPDWIETVVDREEAEDRHWDARDDAPFVTWYELEVEGCPIPVTPTKPTITASGECEVADTLNIPEMEGVVYTVEPEYTEGATGTFEVTATAEEGYELEGKTSWTMTIDEPEKCPAPKPDDDEKEDEELAATGAPLQLMIGAGLLLLVGGGAAMAVARRRGIV